MLPMTARVRCVCGRDARGPSTSLDASYWCRLKRKDKHPMRETSSEVRTCRPWISRLAVAIMFAALSATLASAQKISPEEQKLVDYIDAHSSEATALLEKTVNIESPTENLAGVREVGAIFKTEFEALGFTARWINM